MPGCLTLKHRGAHPRRTFLSPSKSPPTCKMYFCETNPTSKYGIPNKINMNLITMRHNDAQNEPKFNRPQPRRCLPIGPIRLIRPIPSFSCSSSPPLPRRSATKTGRILDSIRRYESLLHPKSTRINRNQAESSVSAKKIQRAQTRQKPQIIGQFSKKRLEKHLTKTAKNTRILMQKNYAKTNSQPSIYPSIHPHPCLTPHNSLRFTFSALSRTLDG